MAQKNIWMELKNMESLNFIGKLLVYVNNFDIYDIYDKFINNLYIIYI
jgi:hypothetical protein